MDLISYKIDTPKAFSQDECNSFLDLLKQQGKVKNPTIEKVNRCKLLCICIVNNKIVSIGALKPKTATDFTKEKADLSNLSNMFDNELGYCFTLPDYTGKGYSSSVVKLILNKSGNHNIMASTELDSNNSMKAILEKNGFKLYGKPWKSGVHSGALGLYLKFTK